MAKSSHANPMKIISLVLAITFGLVVAVAGYKVYKGEAFELRSKAASETIMLKKWTFDANAEGWRAEGFKSNQVASGEYALVIHDRPQHTQQEEVCTGSEKRGNYRCRNRNVTRQYNPRITHSNVDTVLKYPQNTFRIQIALQSAGRLAREGQGTSVAPRVSNVPVEIAYRLQGKNEFEPPVVVSVNSNGALRDYSFDFPASQNLKKVEAIRVGFNNLRNEANATVRIAEISIVGMQLLSNPRPSPMTEGTYVGVVRDVGANAQELPSRYRLEVSGSPQERMQYYYLVSRPQACPSGRVCPMIAVRPIDFSAYVGTTVSVTGTIGLEPQRETLPNDATLGRVPYGLILYVTSIRPTNDRPVPSVAPGCRYQDVQCVQAPCDPVLICPGISVSPRGCTRELLLCPDGATRVGRTGPNCEYAPCPPMGI